MDYPEKRSVLDVLMFLIEYCEETELELVSNREALSEELRSAGFATPEVERAFDWLESLPVPLGSGVSEQPIPISGTRVYSPEEQIRLSRESRGLLTYLEQTGLLDRRCLEGVIDRALALESGLIDVDQLKWVLLMVLFNQRGQEGLFASMEQLLRAGSAAELH